jgi:hypothetical protein
MSMLRRSNSKTPATRHSYDAVKLGRGTQGQRGEPGLGTVAGSSGAGHCHDRYHQNAAPDRARRLTTYNNTYFLHRVNPPKTKISVPSECQSQEAT